MRIMATYDSTELLRCSINLNFSNDVIIVGYFASLLLCFLMFLIIIQVQIDVADFVRKLNKLIPKTIKNHQRDEYKSDGMYTFINIRF